MAVFIDRRELLRLVGRGRRRCGRIDGVADAGMGRSNDAGRCEHQRRLAGDPRVPLANGIIPHAGETSMELYHRHPHDPKEEIVQPEDIRLQTRLTMRNHKEILDWAGLGWRNVVKLTRYQKRMDETKQIDEVLRSYFKDWWPPQTIYEISGLSSPQARLEIDMWVVPNATRVVVG